MKKIYVCFVMAFLMIAVVFCPGLRAAEEGTDYPMGAVGVKFRLWAGENYLRISQVTSGDAGDRAGLRVDDFVYGAFGDEFDPLGADFNGLVQDLGVAVDRAEAGDGDLPLMVLRHDTGAITVTVELEELGALSANYPLNSPKYDAAYEEACDYLHQKVMDGNGNIGYPTFYAGIALLGHADAMSTTGSKPYRLSLDKIRDFYINTLTNAIYAPVESLMLDGVTDNPHYVSAGLENWGLGGGMMFLGMYRLRLQDGDSVLTTTLQRGVELSANRVQWWKQPPLNANGYSPTNTWGIVGHGGVSGDYIHLGWGGGINICGMHLFTGMALAKQAGVDMSVRPRDGHYFGYANAPANAVPVGMEDYDHTLDEKFQMMWDWMAGTCSKHVPGDINNGSVGYTIHQGGSPYDAGARTPGTLYGMLTYHDGVPGDPTDAIWAEAEMDYITLNHSRHLNCHAYNIGGVGYQQLAAPLLNTRSRRYYMDNWKFFYNLMRQSDNSSEYWRGRSFGDAYQNLPNCAHIDMALAGSVAAGRIPYVNGYNTNCVFAVFNSPYLRWPELDHRYLSSTNRVQLFDLTITDGLGNALPAGSYTAEWSVVSGLLVDNSIFSSTNTADTTVTFPGNGSYEIQFSAVWGTNTVTEPILVEIAGVPEGWIASEVNYDIYKDIYGDKITDLTGASSYPDSPDISRILSKIEGDYSGDIYGARLYGCIVPPVSGDYTFFIASDDYSQFSIAANSTNPAAASVVASVSGWCSQYQWTTYASQKSVTISLTAGALSYFEVLHKEGGGGDHVAVAWVIPGTTATNVIESAYLARRAITDAAIVQQPQSVEAAMGASVEFSIATTGGSPKLYQWRLNGVPYWPPSADSLLTLSDINAGLAGSYDCLYTSPEGVLISDAATLTITNSGGTATGGLWQSVYDGIGGNPVSDLTENSKFPLFSDSSGVITSAATASLGESYGQRWTGWLVPAETAQYRFYITCDDSAELWLSTDESITNRQMIVSRGSYCGAKAWTSVTPSSYISLTNGERYCIEVLHKEGGGGDHCAVTWQKSGDSNPTNGHPEIQGEFLEYEIGGTLNETYPYVTVTALDSYANETGPESAVFKISRELSISTTCTVYFDMSGTAVDGTDYTSLGTQVVLNPGVVSTNIVLTPFDDGLPEPAETATLTLRTDSAYGLRTTKSATITIITAPVPPVWTDNPVKIEATVNRAISATLAGRATDQNGDPITFSKISGLPWLTVAEDGTLTGTPTALGVNTFVVKVTDDITGSNQATLEITVGELVPVAHWKLDEGSGLTAADFTGNNHTGTLAGASWTGGWDGGALAFNGSSDNVTCGNVPVTGQLTLMAWVKPAVVIGSHAIIGKDNALSFKIQGSELQFTVPGLLDHNSTGADVAADLWQHVAVTFDAGQAGGVKFYKNGVFISQVNASTDRENSNVFILGLNQWNQYFNGSMDDVRLYDTIFTASEIASLYDSYPPSGNLISNGSFEVAPVQTVNQTQSSELGTSNYSGDWGNVTPDGWSCTDRIWYMTDSAGTAQFPDGDFAMRIDAALAGTPSVDLLSQTNLNLKAGSTYQLSFYLWGEAATTRIDVDLSGAAALSLLDDRSTAGSDGVAELVTVSFTPAVTGGYTIEFSVDPSDGTSGHAWVDDLYLEDRTLENQPPVFTGNPMNRAGALHSIGYIGTLLGSATDADGDKLTYSKVSGPLWLNVADDGTLTGKPIPADLGTNTFAVMVSDIHSATDDAELKIIVLTGTVVIFF